MSKAGNGVEVDISRPFYDADPTIIQEKLKVLEFEGGFGTFEEVGSTQTALGVQRS